MASQQITKFLRNKSETIESRLETANRLADHSLDVYLPQKELVLLEWAMAMLSTDAAARRSGPFWLFVKRIWLVNSVEARQHIFKTTKFVNVILDTLKECPLLEVQECLAEIFPFVVLQFSSTSQAGQMVFLFLEKQKSEKPHQKFWSEMYAQVKLRPGIFEEHPKALLYLLELDLPLDTVDGLLRNYFLVKDINFTDHITGITCKRAFKSILDTGLDVDQRFEALINADFCRLGDILAAFPQYKPTAAFIDEWSTKILAQKNVDWTSLILLMKLSRSGNLQCTQKLLDIMATNPRQFDEVALIDLFDVHNKHRASLDIVKHWAAIVVSTNSLELTAPGVISAMHDSVRRLSEQELLEVLSDTSLLPSLDYILPGLSYYSYTEAVGAKLSSLMPNLGWPARFAVLSLDKNQCRECPTKAPSKVSLSFVGTLLATHELHPEPEKLSNDMGKVLSKCDFGDELTVLFPRFYKVLNLMNEKVLSTALGRIKDFESILRVNDVYEYQPLSDLAVNLLCDQKTFRPDLLTLLPGRVLSPNHKVRIVEQCIAQKEYVLLAKFLGGSNRATEIEKQPKVLLDLVKKMKPEECQHIFSLARVLSTQKQYREHLAGLLSLDKWQHQCIASALGIESPKILEIAAKNLGEGKLVSPSLCVVANLQEDLIADENVLQAIVELIPKTPPTDEACRTIFRVLCVGFASQHWSLLAAYYLYTGSRFKDELSAYFKTLPQTQLLHIFDSSLQQLQFDVSILAAQHLDKDDLCSAVVVTFLACTNQDLSVVSGSKLVPFAEFLEQLLVAHSWMISQYSLEASLAIVIGLARFPSPDSASSYLSMTRLLSRILLHQRYRLGGRMHIVMAAICALLECLSGTKSHQRSWVLDRSPDERMAMVDAFNRLVQTFFDPPQYSVKSHASQGSLTSEVAKARRVASKSTGSLITTFASVSLERGFLAEVLVKLREGLYPAFNCLTNDGLAAITGLMDHSSRTALRSVYDEYKTQGRWTKD